MEVFEDESHQHPEPLTASSEIQSNSELPVKKAPLTPTQVCVSIRHVADCEIIDWCKVFPLILETV